MSVTHWIEKSDFLINWQKIVKQCGIQSSHSLALIDYYYYPPSTPPLNSGLNHAWLNHESINQAWIDQWSSSILVGFLITKMLTYIPNTYSITAHKAVKEWMACFGCSCASAQFKYIIWGPCSHFFCFQIYQKQWSSLANSFFLLLHGGLQLACAKTKSCVLIHCKQATLLIPPWIGNLLAAGFTG